MRPEDFESHLGRQPLRQVPEEWREGILSAVRQAGRNQAAVVVRCTSWRELLSTLNSQLSTLLWPHPAAWAGLAAVWVVILGLHSARGDASRLTAKGVPPPSAQVFMAFQEQQRLLSELIAPRETPAADRSEPIRPRPRSERRSGLLMV